MNQFDLLRRHEGVRGRPYCDKCGSPILRGAHGWFCSCNQRDAAPGNMTIGVGHNLDARPLDGLSIDAILQQDYAEANDDLLKFPWVAQLNAPRQAAVLDMRFNLGAARFRAFHAMLERLANSDFEGAADAMLDSLWAKQVPVRAAEDAWMIRTGEWPNG